MQVPRPTVDDMAQLHLNPKTTLNLLNPKPILQVPRPTVDDMAQLHQVLERYEGRKYASGRRTVATTQHPALQVKPKPETLSQP